jgi:hypothetical protein
MDNARPAFLFISLEGVKVRQIARGPCVALARAVSRWPI